MLDAETKRRIDSARDTLVGKVPDPKSQVEQITIALIYKFMDDIDARSEELGGERAFFAGEFERYGWAKLMQPGLGGHETLNLYAEAIERMDQNAGVPQLFRDIFSNAFLPYRDPETLRAFLKVIDGFTYDHSERLGDAFEYLLSVMDSQGDAGQFRTPRHVIDFIVAIVDPKKDETVLDPACGTAGFLISAYRHIRAANRDSDGNDTLTSDDRTRLAASFTGYDISPDMVRLSLVNMYLHELREPHIFEYDTLTSEERWEEFADVILANPPFMSPKGGIRPHSRFSVKSKRSEVLFVDYMTEHLNAGGRAGIIVPEGIIFQGQNAHKRLRKKLVEESLVAVVSLPAGVFNPYSGVKTSILLLDRTLARRSQRIAFFKVENDGYDLGKQRRPIDKDDLPRVKAEVAAYLEGLRAGEARPAASVAESSAAYAADASRRKQGLVVEKERIAADGEYNLSGERYRERVKESKWHLVRIGEVAEELRTGFACGKGQTGEVGIPHIRPMNLTTSGQFTWQGLKRISEVDYRGREKYELRPGDVLFNNTNSKELVGKSCHISELIKGGFSNHITRIRVDEERCVSLFLAHILHSAWRNGLFLELANKWIGQAGINLESLRKFQIPLPPLEVQQEIVAEIEGYQKVIDGARAVVENYRPHIHVDPEWPVVEVKDVCTINPKKSEIAEVDGATSVSFVPMSDMGTNRMYFSPQDHRKLEDVSGSYTLFRNKDVLIARVTPCFENGKAGIAKGLLNGIGFGSSEFYVLRPDCELLSEWVYLCLATPAFRKWATPKMAGTGGLQRVPKTVLERYEIPLPNLGIQQQIFAEIEAEQALVDANRELIERMEKKIQDALGRVWESKRK